MQWNAAGRPPKEATMNKLAGINQPAKYTKRELEVHKDGTYALALAVYRMWVADGKPQNDKPIPLFADIIHQHRQIAGDRDSLQRELGNHVAGSIPL